MGGAIIASAMTELIAIAAVAVVAWFAAGTIWNFVRTGRELLRWMQGGPAGARSAPPPCAPAAADRGRDGDP